MKKLRLCLLLAAGIALRVSATEQAPSNMLIILDASNSMWGQVGGVAKIQTAKEVLASLLSDLPEDTKVGLMAYGHRVEDDCQDVETLSGIGSESPDALVSKINAISPRGKTPIAYSLQASAANFDSVESANNNVVVISDGIESCGGDPCKEAAALASKGIGVRVHVVGFDVDAEARTQLECIAENGNGKYFHASDTAAFKLAVAEVQQVAQAEPEPEGPTITEVFRDDFDGDELADHWEVQNPAPDAFIVEDGRLLLISNSVTGFHHADMPNMLTLNRDLPSGDWDVNVTFSAELGTSYEWLWLGLRKDEQNYLASLFYNVGDTGAGQRKYYFALRIDRLVSGKKTQAEVTISGLGYGALMQRFAEGPATLTLSKRGRSYVAAFQIDGLLDENEEPHVFRTSKLTSLRSPGELTLGIGLHRAASGELLALIDSVQIVTVEE